MILWNFLENPSSSSDDDECSILNSVLATLISLVAIQK
jgi:hypothetical protein